MKKRDRFHARAGLALGAVVWGCSADAGDPGPLEADLDVAPKVSAQRCKPTTFTEEEWARLAALSPLPDLPIDPSNAVADDQGAQKLGRKLFFDPGFAGPLKVASDLGDVGETGKVACSTCHSGPMLADERSEPPNVSLGADFHSRNAPGLVNSSFYAWTNWGGRFSAQWELPMPVVESGVIMNGNRLAVVHRIFDHYRRPYEKVFGPLDPAIGADLVRFPRAGKPKAAATDPDGAWESMTAEDRQIVLRVFTNYGKALAAYVRTLVSRRAPFDRFVAGRSAALTAQQRRGAKLFVGKGRCAGCHSGPHFSDGGFHNLGVPQTGPNVPATDDGRFKDVPPLLASTLSASGVFSDDPEYGAFLVSELTNPMPESSRGAFRTPTLRGVALTAPYMHSGQLGTLEEVIDFYDQGGGTPASGTKSSRLAPLGLTQKEKTDLVAFLHSLTGEPVKAK